MSLTPFRALCAAVLVFAACSAQAADTCDSLKTRIEANIAGNGVQDFSITVVDDAAVVTGQVVGHCANGTQKIVYSRGAGAGAPSAGAAAQPVLAPGARPPAKARGILTECKDGKAAVGGSCQR